MDVEEPVDKAGQGEARRVRQVRQVRKGLFLSGSGGLGAGRESDIFGARKNESKQRSWPVGQRLRGWNRSRDGPRIADPGMGQRAAEVRGRLRSTCMGYGARPVEDGRWRMDGKSGLG